MHRSEEDAISVREACPALAFGVFSAAYTISGADDCACGCEVTLAPMGFNAWVSG